MVVAWVVVGSGGWLLGGCLAGTMASRCPPAPALRAHTYAYMLNFEIPAAIKGHAGFFYGTHSRQVSARSDLVFARPGARNAA